MTAVGISLVVIPFARFSFPARVAFASLLDSAFFSNHIGIECFLMTNFQKFTRNSLGFQGHPWGFLHGNDPWRLLLFYLSTLASAAGRNR